MLKKTRVNPINLPEQYLKIFSMQKVLNELKQDSFWLPYIQDTYSVSTRDFVLTLMNTFSDGYLRRTLIDLAKMKCEEKDEWKDEVDQEKVKPEMNIQLSKQLADEDDINFRLHPRKYAKSKKLGSTKAQAKKNTALSELDEMKE